MTSNEICLPTKSLTTNGAAPEQGGPIEIQTLKGTVTRIEGGNTYFRPTEINGQPIAAGDENTEGELPPEDGMPTRDDLLARAKEEDEDGSY
jgi:hypothetical protein